MIDTNNLFLDSQTQNMRINIVNNTTVLDTDKDRINLINPTPYKFYFVKDTNKLYIYNDIVG